MLLQHLYYSFSNNGSCNKLFNEHVPFQMQTWGRHHIHHSCTPAPQLGAWLRIRAPGICYVVSQSIFHPVVLCTVHSGPQEKICRTPQKLNCLTAPTVPLTWRISHLKIQPALPATLCDVLGTCVARASMATALL